MHYRHYNKIQKEKNNNNNKSPLTLQLLWNKKTKTTILTIGYKMTIFTMAIRKARKVWLWVSFQRLQYDPLRVHDLSTRELTIIISDLLECQLLRSLTTNSRVPGYKIYAASIARLRVSKSSHKS